MIEEKDHHYWMRQAIALAARAQAQGEVPVGALVVKENEVIGEGWNQPITLNNPSAHAELMAIQQAAAHLENYRIPDTTLYVTLEPCPMCAGLMVHARIANLVFGAFDQKTGCAGSIMNLTRNPLLNHQINVIGGVLADECSTQISEFFKLRRAQIKQQKQNNKL
ncbi:tRNA adenosine(34) deaminase TadA [Alteromonas facilis]|uniref:tRNA adenosine(34) deaminase TadA n=1 Tax=Alteromonas facilis TaxID=2048004 RepID=UPI000C287B2D|nr:tRNA adenosine(34) deaminase TadA [Alteromonas facilis]